MVPIPSNELLDSLLDRGRRTETDIALKVVDIGISRRNVARLHRQKLAVGFLAKGLLDQTDDLQQLHWTIIANVVDPPRSCASSRRWLLARPIRIPGRRALD